MTTTPLGPDSFEIALAVQSVAPHNGLPHVGTDAQFDALVAQLPVSRPHPDPKSGVELMQGLDRAAGYLGDGTHLPMGVRGAEEAARQADAVPEADWQRFAGSRHLHAGARSRKR